MIKLQFIPHSDLANLDSDQKLKKILKSVKEDKIILIEGRLNPVEESELIKRTMEEINRKFKGIEICSITNKSKKTDWVDKLKLNVANFILGKNDGMTIVGPATVIKEIKRDPNKIELLTYQLNNKRKKRK